MAKTAFSSYQVLVMLLLYCFVVTLANPATNITSDQSALLMFKTNIIDPHYFLNDWSASNPVCNWTGVTCGSRHRRVTALDLSNMSLEGIVPPTLGDLSFLISLDMSLNQLYWSLPPELAHLRRLKSVNFYANHLNGSVPEWLGLFSKLEYLHLGNNSFSGPLPRSMGNLSNLQVLIMSSNFLEGEILQELGNLRKLVFLNLIDNQLIGSIPRAILNISSLETFAFTENLLSGKLPPDLCRHLPNLKGLYLSSNLYDGPIPSSLYECVQLIDLSLSYNKLTGPILKHIGNLTMLKNLAIGRNNLTGVLPQEIGNLHQLESFGCEVNNLEGIIPRRLFNISTLQLITFSFNNFWGSLPSDMGNKMTNLERLYLSTGQLMGVIPDTLSNCSKLIELDLSYNKFTGPVPSSLGCLESLETLYLENNSLGESIFKELSFFTSLGNCRNLINMVVATNPLNGFIPHSIGNLSNSLSEFYAYECKLGGRIPDELGNLSSLRVLSLYNNDLEGSIPATFEGLQELQGLDIAFNRVSGLIPSDLCKLLELNELELSGNQLSGAIPLCIGNITSLRYVDLSRNRLVSSIPSSLWNSRDLLQLNLSSNLLSGSLPQEIGNLKVLYYISLSSNRFSGMVPLSLGDLKSLQYLSLANNSFSGTIPESLGTCSSLEVLDLSKNILSGVIPKSLEKLKYLKYFNASFNNLTGEIPDKGLFSMFDWTSFMSNEALCGSSQFRVQPCDPISEKKSKRAKVLRLVFILLGITFVFVASTMVVFLKRYKRRKEAPVPADLLLRTATVQRISYYDLLRATEGYNERNLLGTGSFGSVYKGLLQDDMIVAVKVFNLHVEGASRTFEAECEVLRNARHRNLAKVISSCSNEDFKALVLEYMPNGSLEKWLYSANYSLDMMERLNIMIDVASALEYLHHGYSTQIVHCDLKPSNILLDENKTARVSDFGLTKFLNEADSFEHTNTLATLGYIAPEYGREGLVSPASDVYSFGIVLMETFTRTKPSDEKFTGDQSMKQWIQSCFPNELVQALDADLLDQNDTHRLQALTSIIQLALNCCAESPKNRMNMKDAHETLKKIKVQTLDDISRT